MQDFNTEILLVFAHRAEAQAFMSNASAVPYLFEGVWHDRDIGLILICGEGLDAARERVACVLASYPEVQRVINLGVAGALRPNTTPGEIYSVRTCYGENEFKSYTSNDPEATQDCVSAKNRVLTAARALALDNFAPLVERELWAIASVCTLLSKKWCAFKLISDVPYSEELGETEICQIVKDEASKWSQRFFEFYHDKIDPQNQSGEAMAMKTEIDLGDDFYLTISMSRQIESLKARLAPELYNGIRNEIMAQQFSKPKERTLAFIHHLNRALNPFRAKLEDKIDEICAPLVNAGIQVSYPWPLESAHLNLKIQIQSLQDLERVAPALSEFSFDSFAALTERGEFNV